MKLSIFLDTTHGAAADVPCGVHHSILAIFFLEQQLCIAAPIGKNHDRHTKLIRLFLSVILLSMPSNKNTWAVYLSTITL